MTAPAAGRPRGELRAWIAIAAVWLMSSAAMAWQARSRIVALEFRDTDDALRLVEVRAWTSGQGWFDVTQHRINPPVGSPMHWSRVVDLPLAALDRLACLFVTPPQAERIAAACVPLLTLLILFGGVYALVRTLTGRPGAAVLGCVMLPGLTLTMGQFEPLRIDHHGWQIALGVAATALVIGARGHRGRIIAAAGVSALALTVSIEALPLAAALAATAALRFVRGRSGMTTLAAYLAGLAGFGAALLVVTLGEAARVAHCDSASPAYLVPMAAAALALLLGRPAAGPGASWLRRSAVVVAAGAVAALVFVICAPQCLGGPFGDLNPLLRRVWLGNVLEGLPVWRQRPALVPLMLYTPVIGLLGTLAALRWDTADRRDAWLDLLVIQAIALFVALAVARAAALSQVLALPGMAWACLEAGRRALRQPRAAARILGGFACGVGLSPAGALAASAIVAQVTPADPAPDRTPGLRCASPAGLAVLGAQPSGLVFAPLDLGPFILVATNHAVVATPHHRNAEAMTRVVRAFTSTADAAAGEIRSTRARYLAYCPDASELELYAQLYPTSLAADLKSGRVPPWLEPRVTSGPGPRIYRIIDPQGDRR